MIKRGQYLFFSLCLVGSAAFSLSLSVLCFCDFVTRTVDLTDAGYHFCNTIEQISPTECEVFLQNHSIGFFGFQGRLPSSESVTCFSYHQIVNDLQYQSSTLDSKMFKAAKAFAVAAAILGGIAFLALVLVFCSCPGLQQHIKLLSLCYTIAAISQGLSLLVLDSSVCNSSQLDVYYPNSTKYNGSQADKLVSDVSCGLTRGSRIAIATIVLYTWCVVVSIKAVPVTVESLTTITEVPINGDSGTDKANDAENHSPTADAPDSKRDEVEAEQT